MIKKKIVNLNIINKINNINNTNKIKMSFF